MAGRKEQLTFIHPYDDPLIVAGQGTLEMLAAVPDLDVLIIPIGGGGLISGIDYGSAGLDWQINECVRVLLSGETYSL